MNSNKPNYLPATKNRLPEDQGLGKLPPQETDLEEAVLGAIMLEKHAMTLVGALLKPHIFYKDANKLIYEAIQELDHKSDPIDLLTVTNMLKKQGKLEEAGGAYYITQLTSGVSSSANIEYHTRLLQEAWMKRESIRFAQDLIQIGFDSTSDPFDIIDIGTKYVLDMTSQLDNGKTTELRPAIRTYIEELAVKMNIEGDITGAPCGILSIDRVTGGWQNTDLVIVAARPAMGKTAFVLRSAISSAKAGFPVALFSLEMSRSQLIDRIVGQELRIAGASDLKRGRISQTQYESIIARIQSIYELPIFIDDTPGIRLSEIRAKCYSLVRNKGVKKIIIDYLQLVTADDSGNREQQISSISRGVKKIAKELNVPIILLSQLSRAVETRGGDKRPQLSDLRESGAIEQDADMVAFLYRPEYYNIMEDEEGRSTAGLAEFIIAKNRAGAIDTLLMEFIGKYTDFQDLKDDPFPTPVQNSEINDISYANKFKNNYEPF